MDQRLTNIPYDFMKIHLKILHFYPFEYVMSQIGTNICNSINKFIPPIEREIAMCVKRCKVLHCHPREIATLRIDNDTLDPCLTQDLRRSAMQNIL